MLGGYLCISKAEMLLLSPSNPHSNEVPSYKGSPSSALVEWYGNKHMRVLGDSNLVVSQVKGDFSLREPSLTSSGLRRKR